MCGSFADKIKVAMGGLERREVGEGGVDVKVGGDVCTG